MNKNKTTIIFSMGALIDISFVSFIYTVNSQVYNESEQQKYGAIIVFPLQPPKTLEQLKAENEANRQLSDQILKEIHAKYEKEDLYYQNNNPLNLSRFDWLRKNLSDTLGLNQTFHKYKPVDNTEQQAKYAEAYKEQQNMQDKLAEFHKEEQNLQKEFAKCGMSCSDELYEKQYNLTTKSNEILAGKR